MPNKKNLRSYHIGLLLHLINYPNNNYVAIFRKDKDSMFSMSCPYVHTSIQFPYFHIISILLRGSSQIPKMYRKGGRISHPRKKKNQPRNPEDPKFGINIFVFKLSSSLYNSISMRHYHITLTHF